MSRFFFRPAGTLRRLGWNVREAFPKAALLSGLGAMAILTPAPLLAQAINVGAVAVDTAANDTLPGTAGATASGGFGFESWIGFGYTGPANNGTFVGNSQSNGTGGGTNIGNPNAWGMYDNNGATVGDNRAMSTGLAIGQSISFDYDNGFIDTGRRQEVILYSASGGDRLSFGFTGGGTNYTALSGPGLGTSTSFATGFVTSGLHITLTRTGIDTVSATVGQAGATDVLTNLTLGGAAGSGINGITIKDNDTTSGAAHDFFTNNLNEYTPTIIAAGDLATAAPYSGGNNRIATVGSSLNFDGPAGGTVINNNIGALYNIAFNATAAGANSNGTANAAAYILTGNGGGSSLVLNGGVNNNSTNLQTINSALTLGADQAFAATNAGLTFGGKSSQLGMRWR